MEKIVEKYKKQQLFKDIGFGILAFAIGFGVSYFMNSGNINTGFLKSDISNSIKINNSSIIEKNQKIIEKDLFIKKGKENIFSINLAKKIENPTNISFTLIYDPKKISIEKVEKKDILKETKVLHFNVKPGMMIVSITPQKNTLIFGKILDLKIKKNFKSGDDFSFINISLANYQKKSDNNQKEFYPITVSGINVF